MRDAAEELGIPILDPPNVNDEAFVEQLATFQADLFVVCDYGQILSKKCLAAAEKGGINLHGSFVAEVSRRRARELADLLWRYRNRRVSDSYDPQAGCGPRLVLGDHVDW